MWPLQINTGSTAEGRRYSLFARWRHFIFQSLYNKLCRSVQNEVILSCAKFGADLVNIAKVTGRKQSDPVLARPTRYVYVVLRSLAHLTGSPRGMCS